MTIDERQQPSEAEATTTKATDLAEVPELQFKASAEHATTPDGDEKDKLDDKKDKVDNEKDKVDDDAGKINVPAHEVSTDDYDELSGNNETSFDDNGQPIIVTGYDVSRYIVSTRDDGDPAFTFRGIVLGTIFTALASTISMIYTFKPAQSSVSGLFLQLLVWIFGAAWARFTPQPHRFKSAWVQKTLRFVNSGQPFLIKEHVVASLIASSSNNAQAGIEIYAVERLYYNKATDVLTALLGTFSITTIGFVLAGVMRPLLIYPSETVFWGTLPQVILFQNIHHDMKNNKERIRRFTRWFSLAFLWELFPSYIAPWTSGLSIFCLASMKASPQTQSVFTTVFGGAGSNEGTGLLSLCLDWQYIQSSFLSLPLKQQFNSWIGLVISFIALPVLYYSNAWNSRDLPFMSTALFTQSGGHFHQLSVLNDDYEVDPVKLAAIGLPRLTSSTLWGFFTQCLAIGALIVHVVLFYGPSVVKTIKSSRAGTLKDPHYQAMRKYKEVPLWWYGIVFALSIISGVVVCAKGETGLPVWGFFVALLLGTFIAPISSILLGLFGNGIATNSLSKMVAGVVHPGKPLANLWFAAWSHQIVLLSLNLSNWLKIGQYTKVPHRTMFLTQMYASLLGAVFNYLVMVTIVTHQRDVLLGDGQGNHTWSAAYIGGLNTAAVTWSMARDVYSIRGPYAIVPMGLVIGATLPLLHYFVLKLWKRGVEKRRQRGERQPQQHGGKQSQHEQKQSRRAPSSRWPLATPIVCAYSGANHSGTTSWITSTIIVGVVSQFIVRTRHATWFNNWNYLLAAALDGGSQTMIFILSFAVFGAGGKAIPFPTWFGNPSQDAGRYPDHCLATS